MQLKADPNFKLLGARLKGDQKKVVDYLKTKVTEEELSSLLETGKLIVLEHEVTSEEVSVSYCSSGVSAAGDHFETHADSQTVVMLDVSEDSALKEEGLAREVINRIQKLRKMAKLVTTDSATVYLRITPPNHLVATVIHRYGAMISNTTGSPLCLDEFPVGANVLTSMSTIKDAQIEVALITSPSILVQYGENSHRIKLFSAEGQELTYSRLLYETRALFSLWNRQCVLFSTSSKNDASTITATEPLSSFAGKTLYVIVSG